MSIRAKRWGVKIISSEYGHPGVWAEVVKLEGGVVQIAVRNGHDHNPVSRTSGNMSVEDARAFYSALGDAIAQATDDVDENPRGSNA